MNNKFIFLAIPLAVLILMPSCKFFESVKINGVKITKHTKWQNIIDDYSDRSQMEAIRYKAEMLLLTSRFDELDAMAAQYRASRQKFKNGEWALNVFYSGLSHYLLQKDGQVENWEVRLSQIREWVKARPNSVTARVALSECLVGYAFAGRGYGYANTVSEDQRRVFNERNLEAQSVLNEFAAMRDACPQWRAASMRFHGQDWTREKFLEVFQEAIQFDPEFSMYYFRTAIVLMPRW